MGGGEIKKFDKPLERLAKKEDVTYQHQEKRGNTATEHMHQQDKGIPWTALHRYIWKLTQNGPIPLKSTNYHNSFNMK